MNIRTIHITTLPVPLQGRFAISILTNPYRSRSDLWDQLQGEADPSL